MSAINATELSDILELTENILVMALQQEWDSLNQLQLDQGKRLKALLSGIESVSIQEKEILSKIKSLTNQAIDLAENEKGNISIQLTQIKKSANVQKAYQQHVEK